MWVHVFMNQTLLGKKITISWNFFLHFSFSEMKVGWVFFSEIFFFNVKFFLFSRVFFCLDFLKFSYTYHEEISSIGNVRLTWQTSLTGTTKIFVLICLGLNGRFGHIRSGEFLFKKPRRWVSANSSSSSIDAVCIRQRHIILAE